LAAHTTTTRVDPHATDLHLGAIGRVEAAKLLAVLPKLLAVLLEHARPAAAGGRGIRVLEAVGRHLLLLSLEEGSCASGIGWGHALLPLLLAWLLPLLLGLLLRLLVVDRRGRRRLLLRLLLLLEGSLLLVCLLLRKHGGGLLLLRRLLLLRLLLLLLGLLLRLLLLLLLLGLRLRRLLVLVLLVLVLLELSHHGRLVLLGLSKIVTHVGQRLLLLLAVRATRTAKLGGPAGG
jgi:hypothetical protein